MSKLMKLKKFFTLNEAAFQMSKMLDEPVSEADLLQQVISRNLILSVNFVNTVMAQPMKIFPASEVEVIKLPGIKFSDDEPDYEIERLNGTPISDDECLVNDGDIHSITGVFDLPLIGGECVVVENKYYDLIDGPRSGWVCLEGSFVHDLIFGVYYKLLDRINHNNPRQNKLHSFKEQVQLHDNLFPLDGLPDDVMFVFRTENLLDFSRKLLEPTDVRSQFAETKERDTLLKMIYGMALRPP